MRSFFSFVALLAFVLATAAGGAFGQTNQTTDAGGWHDDAIWSEGHAPEAGESVQVLHDVTITNASPVLASLSVSGATLTFTNWDTKVTATHVTVEGNGTITHGINPDTASPWVPEARVWIDCSNLTVTAGSAIQTDAKGYRGQTNSGGYGPGGGLFSYTAGGGYGGVGSGSRLDKGVLYGQTYGSVSAPEDPGSAGGGHKDSGIGGHGGGAIKIEASGDVTVDGTVSAQGGPGTETYRGGGSGGSVSIQCRRLLGGGALTVRGGGTTAEGSEGGGGGGRLAVLYSAAQSNLVSQPSITFDAGWGYGKYSSTTYYGEMGTIYLPDALLLTEDLARFTGEISGFGAWAPGHLTVTNQEVHLAGEGMRLTVTNDILVDGSAAKLAFGSAVANTYGSSAWGTNGFQVRVGGNVVVTNGGELSLFAGVRDGGNTNRGALLSVTGELSIADSSSVYSYSHRTNGTATAIEVGRLTVAANAQLSADGRGYAPADRYDYWGVGAGKGRDSGSAGHGGGGTAGSSGTGGGTYGASNAPVRAGSSGGLHASHPGGLSQGGGLVYVRTDGDIRVDGSISANGKKAGGQYDGGGSGGAIFLDCGSLLGNGVLSANGGDGGTSWGGGSGGGRISVWYGNMSEANGLKILNGQEDLVARLVITNDCADFSGAVLVDPGAPANPVNAGGTGTVTFLTVPSAKPSVENRTPTHVLLGSAHFNGFLSSTGASPTTVSLYWGESDGMSNAALWAHTNDFTGTQDPGSLTTNLTISSNALYYYRYYAQNADGGTWAPTTEGFATAPVTIEATDPNASEQMLDPGTLTVHRASWATNYDLTVSYAITGTAGNGGDYELLSGSVVMGQGASNAAIVITPIADVESGEGTESIIVTLTGDTCPVGTPGAATVWLSDAAVAPTNTWTGDVGDWTSSGSWSAGHVPVVGQHVVITNGHVTLPTSTVSLASFTITNATLTFGSGWDILLTATNVSILGTLDHATNSATAVGGSGEWEPDARINIACSNFTLGALGVLNADHRGYKALFNVAGCGPGGGQRSFLAGGGYGGKGYQGGGGYGEPYGATNAPMDPGSAGGADGELRRGGNGGGAIRIAATGHVQVDGTVSANGQTGQNTYSGGGSGGGIYIDCATFGGTGTMRTDGGDDGPSAGGGGGGGRIAITYTAAQAGVVPTPAIAFSLEGGIGSYGGVIRRGDPGTLYLTDNSFFPSGSLSGSYALHFPSRQTWNPATLTMGSGWIRFSDMDLGVNGAATIESGGELDLTNGVAFSCDTLDVSGVLRLIGPFTYGHDLALDGDLYITAATNGALLTCNGCLTLTNGGNLYVYSGPTNTPTRDYGGLVEVRGTLLVTSGSFLYAQSDPENGGSVLFWPGNLTVDAGATFGADLGGYRGRSGYSGLGPGGGYDSSGAGYGGVGGVGGYVSTGNDPGGVTYGSSNAPVDPGSNGGMHYTHYAGGNYGGGVVRVDTRQGTIRIDGTLSANGGSVSGTAYSGGGSGGGIYLICRRFAGNTGRLSAAGGNGAPQGGAGGGGGRIAIWRVSDASSGITTDVSGGTGDNTTGRVGEPGAAGTVVWGNIPAMGSVFVVR